MKISWTTLTLAAALGVSTAAPAQSLPPLLHRDAELQIRLTRDVASGAMPLDRAAALEDQAAALYRLEARLWQGATPNAQGEQVRAAQRDLRQAIAQAERAHEHRTSVASMDRMHVHVAGVREAQQQRWIAQALSSHRLSPAQAAQLEMSQADIATAQAALERRGNETVDEALRIQHQQDLQDWAIKTAHPLA
jgi:hypothetical protein